MSSYWLFQNTITCLFYTKFSLSSDSYQSGQYSSSLDRLSIHPQSLLLLKVSVCSDVSLSLPLEELSILNGKKVFIVQDTTYYSRKFDIMVRACEISMKLEHPKEVAGPICSFFTTFAVFTNSTSFSMVLMVKPRRLK